MSRMDRTSRLWRNDWLQTDPNEPVSLSPAGEREPPLPGATMAKDGYDVCSRRPRDYPPGEFRDYDDRPNEAPFSVFDD